MWRLTHFSTIAAEVRMNIIAVLTLVLLLPRIFSACMTGKRNGVLVAEFSNESPVFIFKPNIGLTLIASHPGSGMQFLLHQHIVLPVTPEIFVHTRANL